MHWVSVTQLPWSTWVALKRLRAKVHENTRHLDWTDPRSACKQLRDARQTVGFDRWVESLPLRSRKDLLSTRLCAQEAIMNFEPDSKAIYSRYGWAYAPSVNLVPTMVNDFVFDWHDNQLGRN